MLPVPKARTPIISTAPLCPMIVTPLDTISVSNGWKHVVGQFSIFFKINICFLRTHRAARGVERRRCRFEYSPFWNYFSSDVVSTRIYLRIILLFVSKCMQQWYQYPVYKIKIHTRRMVSYSLHVSPPRLQ